MYGIMYGVKRTTVYFPEDMKASIKREAVRRGVTEAEVIRGAVEAQIGQPPKRRLITPAIPEGIGEDIATRVDELLDGMGSDGLSDR